MRDFIEQGFPYERAKERVEEEFAARNPVVKPPRSGTSYGSTAGSSKTSRARSPAPSWPGRGRSLTGYSTSNASGGSSRYCSPSPQELDPRPLEAEMTLDMLAQELSEEGVASRLD